MDFFSILLPGALLTYLYMDHLGPPVLGDRYPLVDGGQTWAIFLFASYLFGHLVFLLGSWLDLVYDWFRDRTLPRQVEQVARRGHLLGWPIRAYVSLVFKRERNLALDRVVKIKRQALAELQAEDAINAFQWSKTLLNIKSRENLAVVQRFEADSKFFRCFALVMLVLLVFWPFDQQWRLIGTVVVIILLFLALLRYMEQRYKAINQAYWAVLSVTANEGKITFEKSAPVTDGLTHAGGVVIRDHRKTVEYLLVEATDAPNLWVLPKGHIEDGEEDRVTAVREVYEETGVWAGIIDSLEDMPNTVKGVDITTRFFLMRALGRGLRKEKRRRHAWMQLSEAVDKASFPETRDLLKYADSVRRRSRSGDGVG